MAADGVFFPRLAALHPEYRTPTAAILVMAAWSIVLTLSGTFSQLVDYVAFGDWIFFGLTVAGLFVYRARDRRAGVAPPPAGGLKGAGVPFPPAPVLLAGGPGVGGLVRGQSQERVGPAGRAVARS